MTEQVTRISVVVTDRNGHRLAEQTVECSTETEARELTYQATAKFYESFPQRDHYVFRTKI